MLKTLDIHKKTKARQLKWVVFNLISKLSFGKFKIPPEIIANKYRKYASQYRRIVSDSFARAIDYTVVYGPFKGMKVDPNPYWGASDLGIKCLGLYELEIQNILVKLQHERHRNTFVDLGGADGYFAIGVLVNRLFDKCIAYEMDGRGREKLKYNSITNNVQDRLSIKGEATLDSLSDILDNNEGSFILLCDIEGAEYDLFNEEVLSKLKNCNIIIEMHEPYYSTKIKADQLFERASRYFNVDIILTGGRDFSQIEEAHLLSDLDRSLLVSEGRGPIGTWWHLRPIQAAML